MPAADLNEWAAAISVGIAAHAALSVPYFLLVDANPSDFDPRPVLRRAIESGRLDPALIAVVNARHAGRDAAITAAALLMLLAPASPESAR
jgi:hypothetical protein